MEIDDIPEAEPPAGAGEAGSEDEVPATVDPAVAGRSCRNCGTPLAGAFCGACGQSSATLRVSLREIVANAASDLWSLDSRALATGVALVWPPGEITRRYLDGKRARYVPAFRLYLICSLTFFLVLSLTGVLRGGDAAGNPPDEAQRAEMAEVRDDLRRQAADAEGLERSVLIRVERFMAVQEDRGAAGVRSAIADAVRRSLPKVMFFLLPFFALLLKVLYLRREWVYAEHVIFALHYHAFTFTLFTAAVLAGRWVPLWPLVLAVLLYLPLAVRRVYGQGWIRTLTKSAILAVVYFAVCALAVGGLIAWAFWSL